MLKNKKKRFVSSRRRKPQYQPDFEPDTDSDTDSDDETIAPLKIPSITPPTPPPSETVSFNILNLNTSGLTLETPPTPSETVSYNILNLNTSGLTLETPPTPSETVSYNILNLNTSGLTLETPPPPSETVSFNILNLNTNGLTLETPPPPSETVSFNILNLNTNGLTLETSETVSLNKLKLNIDNINFQIPEIITPAAETIKLESKNNGPGLLINDTLVSSISGPVGLTILKPTVAFHKSHHKAPIIILFGDRHNSNDYLCESCGCESDQKSCCYEVYSPQFLKLIDDIAKDHIVYFNIEGGLDIYEKFNAKSEDIYQQIKQASRPYPIIKVREYIHACYSKKYKQSYPESYKNLCPTQHIIWQKADARQSYWEIDKELFYKYDFHKCLQHFFSILRNFLDNTEKAIQSGIKETDKCSKQCSYYFKDDTIILMKSFFEPDFYKRVAEHRRDNNSVSPIYKQIEKMKSEDQRNEWRAYIDEYYKYYEDTKRNKDTLNNETKTFFNKMIDLVKDNKSADLQRLINTKRNVAGRVLKEILSYNGMALDLYFLTRSFKTTSDNKNPLISIGYFGRNHVENLIHFLVNITKNYESVLDIGRDVDKLTRCLVIDKHIDINALIQEYTTT
jgi:hypothetical protein